MGQVQVINLGAGSSLLLSKPPARLSPQKQASPNRTALFFQRRRKSGLIKSSTNFHLWCPI